MKVPIRCMRCIQENADQEPQIIYAEYRDDNQYLLECSQGHETITVLQHMKFEILYEIGAYALIDKYFREAVVSFTSSLERFYEFCIKVFLHQKLLDEEVFRDTWKIVRKSSERELGAFVVSYCLESNNAPILLSEKDASFRNNVVHRGKIPTHNEAFQYGEKILNVIRPILRFLKTNYEIGIFKVLDEYIRESMGSIENTMKSTLISQTILGLSNYGGEHITLEQWIESLKTNRQNLT
jgi:hypothetical protein